MDTMYLRCIGAVISSHVVPNIGKVDGPGILFSSCFIRDFLASGRVLRYTMNTMMILSAAVTTSILNSCNSATGLLVYRCEMWES